MLCTHFTTVYFSNYSLVYKSESITNVDTQMEYGPDTTDSSNNIHSHEKKKIKKCGGGKWGIRSLKNN